MCNICISFYLITRKLHFHQLVIITNSYQKLFIQKYDIRILDTLQDILPKCHVKQDLWFSDQSPWKTEHRARHLEAERAVVHSVKLQQFNRTTMMLCLRYS